METLERIKRGVVTVIERLRKCEQSPAWDRVSVYVIQDKQNTIVGKVQVAHSKDGRGLTHAFLWDWSCEHSREIQHGAAGGCGYDKLASAMHGLEFGPEDSRIIFKDHPHDWRSALTEAGYAVWQAI